MAFPKAQIYGFQCFNPWAMATTTLNLVYFPVDWFKAEVTGISKQEILANPLLNWQTVSDKSAVITRQYAKYKNLLFQVYEQDTTTSGVFFSGSLHYFSNNGLHNYNDFTQDQFEQVIRQLKRCFGIAPENLRLIKLEFGVNITPPIETERILEHLFQLKHRSFTKMIHNKRGHYKQVESTEYILKTYDKARQFNLQNQTLRIEIKQTNWKEFRKKGIKTLADFIQADKRLFLDKLTTRFAECVFYDPANPEAGCWTKYRNEIYWRELRDEFSRQTFSRELEKLRRANREHGSDLQTVICNLITEKVQSLQKVTFSNIREQSRFCAVTGVEISMQRKDSYLLSHVGLTHLIQTDFKRFCDIRSQFLDIRHHEAETKLQIEKIAHAIRGRANRLQKRKSDDFQL